MRYEGTPDEAFVRRIIELQDRVAVLERLFPGSTVIRGALNPLGDPVAPIRVMASPPTVGTKTTATGITTPQTFRFTTNTDQLPMNPTFFRTVVGGDWLKMGLTHPNQHYAEQVFATTGQGSVYGRIEFVVDCTTFEIMHKGATAFWRMWVDGELVSATPVSVPNDGNLYWQPITFASKAIRHIAIDFYSLKYGGIVIGPTDSIWPATETRPKALLFGDSFGEGAGASNVDGFVPNLAKHLGWDIWAGAQGGSGYVNAGTYTGKYATRVGFFEDLNFDVIILTGGYNDMTVGNAASVDAEATALLKTIKQTWPSALIVMCAPFFNKGVEGFTQYTYTVKDALKAVAATYSLPYADLLELPFDEGVSSAGTLGSSSGVSTTSLSISSFCPVIGSTIEIGTGSTKERRVVTNVSGVGPYTATVAAMTNAHTAGEPIKSVGGCLWTGTGRIGATTGVGNCDLYVSSDAVHPSAAGHAAIARALAEQIRLAISNTDLKEQV